MYRFKKKRLKVKLWCLPLTLDSQALSSKLSTFQFLKYYSRDILYIYQCILHKTEISQQYLNSMREAVLSVFAHSCIFKLGDSNLVVPIARTKTLSLLKDSCLLLPYSHVQFVNKSYWISKIWVLLALTIQATILSHLEFYNGLLTIELLPSIFALLQSIFYTSARSF